MYISTKQKEKIEVSRYARGQDKNKAIGSLPEVSVQKAMNFFSVHRQ